jgi:hypothetical protein
MLFEVSYLNDGYTFGLIAMNESHFRQLAQADIEINPIPVREDFSLDPQWPILEAPFAVGKTPKALKQNCEQGVGSA